MEDETAPSFVSSYPAINHEGGTEVIIDIQVDEPSTVYYVALPESSTQPSAIQIINGTDSNDQAVDNGSAVISEANVTTEVTIEGLAEETSYEIFLALQDDAENTQDAVAQLSVTTIDESAPEFSFGYPKGSDIESTSVNLAVALNEIGDVFYVVLVNDAIDPSSAQVKSGTDASDNPALFSGTISVSSAETEFLASLTGLTEETSYDIYLVTEDENSNIQETPTLLEIMTPPTSKDYYWVGGTGNWSDINHWAKSSGGLVFHDTPPTEFDNVFIDNNSFTEDHQEVVLDDDGYCHDMDWSALTDYDIDLEPEEYTQDHLYISGSYTGSSMMRNNLFRTYMTGDGTEIITSNGGDLGVYLHIDGSGSWTIQDEVNGLTGIQIHAGSLEFNADAFTTSFFTIHNTNEFKRVDLTNLELTTNFLRIQEEIGEQLDWISQGSSIYVTREMTSTDADFEELTLRAGGVDGLEFSGSNTIHSMTVEAGAVIKFHANQTQTIDNLTLVGSKFEPISLQSFTPGTQSTISVSSGTVDGVHLILQDMAATGGATFNAQNSIDQGNNSGWNITAPAPLDYYWIGGTGDWSDLSHWSTESGGSSDQADLPGQIDNVYFDDNSFSDNSQAVFLDQGNVAVHDLNFNVSNYSVAVSGGTLNINGSVDLSGSINFLWNLLFKGANEETIQAAGLEFLDLTFNGAGPGRLKVISMQMTLFCLRALLTSMNLNTT